MIKARKDDKTTVLNIIEESFKDNNSVNWVVKNDHRKDQRLRALAEYAFDMGYAKQGVYLSEDKEAVAICFKESIKVNPLKRIYFQLKLFFQAISVKNIGEVLRRQKYLKSVKPKSDYMYFWFFAASDKGKGQGGPYSLQKGIYELSEKNQLPIYLETTIRKNKVVYERFGFEIYHTWHLPKQNFDMWFLRRFPEQTANPKT